MQTTTLRTHCLALAAATSALASGAANAPGDAAAAGASASRHSGPPAGLCVHGATAAADAAAASARALAAKDETIARADAVTTMLRERVAEVERLLDPDANNQ